MIKIIAAIRWIEGRLTQVLSKVQDVLPTKAEDKFLVVRIHDCMISLDGLHNSGLGKGGHLEGFYFGMSQGSVIEGKIYQIHKDQLRKEVISVQLFDAAMSNGKQYCM